MVYTADIASTADFMSVSLAFDPADGNPAIAFAGDRQLLDFAWHDGTDWNLQAIDERTGVAAGAVSLAFNEAFPGGYGDGLPAIAYVAANGDYHYVEDPPIVLSADFDSDGDFDGADFLAWQRGESPRYLDAGDLAAWEANFGGAAVAAATGSVAGVPEPASLASLLVVSFVLLVSGRRAVKK